MDSNRLNSVFAALADPTRRGIIERLREGEQNVAELASGFRMSLPAISKHLKVLHGAGLLERQKSGKYVVCTFNPAPCKEALDWINEQHRFWQDGFDALSTYLDNEHRTDDTNGAK